MSDSAYGSWLDLYGDLYENPSPPAASACPHCASVGFLRLLFVANQPGGGTCRACFWCDHCLLGIGPLRAPVPDSGWPLTSKDEARIPNYTLVPHDSSLS